MAKQRRSNSPAAGTRFGLLTAVRFVRMVGASVNQVWLFKCDCGGERTRSYTEIKLGRFADCGCRQPTRVQRALLFRQRLKVSAFEADLLAVRVEGPCDVCTEAETQIHPVTGIVQLLSVDHCHQTGKVRGVLCKKCNSAEGYLRGLENARRMVAYLERFEKTLTTRQ